ncbi:YihY/virulence factor BrkB family protein [Micromonospora sp. WMMD980]|uniref:YihY/virulence factor BrkB family protein n=1 Tax=Micromonospora sp. WMMD980 TaxID=3016088 RepID=UPI003242B48F
MARNGSAAHSVTAGSGQVPQRLRQMRAAAWRGVFRRAAQGFMKNSCTDLAAGLTYYAVLAVFPSAIVVVALVNLVSEGDRTVDTIVDLLRDLGAGAVVDQQLRDLIQEVVSSQGGAGALLGFGLLGALWSASGYVGGYTRASNVIHGVREGRPFWKLRPLQLLITAVSLLLMAVVVVILIVSGPVTRAVGDALDIGETARTLWSVLKWPALVLTAMVMLAMLGWLAPNVQPPRFRWLTVGGIVTLLAVAIVSFGFGLYVANFSSYDKTYGTLGGVIAFLGWLYLVNGAVLFGVEINAEVQRGRALQAGQPADDPVLPPRTAAEGERSDEVTTSAARPGERPPSPQRDAADDGARPDSGAAILAFAPRPLGASRVQPDEEAPVSPDATTRAQEQHSGTPEAMSTSELVTRAAEQVSTLMRDELALAKAEMVAKGRRAGAGGGLFGGAAVLSLYGLGLLLALAVVVLDLVWPLWLAVLVVLVVVLAVAAVMALLGRRRLRAATPLVPQEAASGITADVDAVKTAVREGRSS